jgi:hypothetical protein
MGKKHWRSRHHLTPRSVGGNNDPSNILILWNEKHEMWHRLFGNHTLEEIIEILQKVRDVKCG